MDRKKTEAAGKSKKPRDWLNQAYKAIIPEHHMVPKKDSGSSVDNLMKAVFGQSSQRKVSKNKRGANT